MDADPEKTPEEELEIIHKAVMLVKKRTDSHENFCVYLTWRFRRADIIYLDCEIEVDEKASVLLLSDHDISNRDIAVQNSSVQ